MERIANYNDYIVRVPYGEDVSRLSSLTQSMGWVIISLNDNNNVARKSTKGLASLRGILKTNDNDSYEGMRNEALNDKYGLNL